jgi:hypothetical protein
MPANNQNWSYNPFFQLHQKGMVFHAYNPSTREVEGGGSQISGQYELYSETLSQKYHHHHLGLGIRRWETYKDSWIERGWNLNTKPVSGNPNPAMGLWNPVHLAKFSYKSNLPPPSSPTSSFRHWN